MLFYIPVSVFRVYVWSLIMTFNYQQYFHLNSKFMYEQNIILKRIDYKNDSWKQLTFRKPAPPPPPHPQKIFLFVWISC